MRSAFSFRVNPLGCRREIPAMIGALALVALAACGADTDYRPVDFSRTTAIESPASANAEKPLLRVAVAAMISPKETFAYYRAMLDYIGERLGFSVQLVQRKTYGEVNEMFYRGEVDLAFICTGPYAVGKFAYGFEGIATPVVRGQPYYQSYLIVNADSPFRDLNDLKDRVFAFTDPESNTGALVPTYWLSELGETPASFFRSVNYTFSHDNSILAIGRNLVDGAAVDGHKWEYYNRRDPEFTVGTRIIRRSEPFGSPPLVAASHLPKELKAEISALVHSMHADPEGNSILNELMIDRFVTPLEEWYDPVRRMIEQVRSNRQSHHASSQS